MAFLEDVALKVSLEESGGFRIDGERSILELEGVGALDQFPAPLGGSCGTEVFGVFKGQDDFGSVGDLDADLLFKEGGPGDIVLSGFDLPS